MSLSECLNCGGHIPLGPRETNRCEKCGRHFWDGTRAPSPSDVARSESQGVVTDADVERAWGALCAAKEVPDDGAKRVLVNREELRAALSAALAGERVKRPARDPFDAILERLEEERVFYRDRGHTDKASVIEFACAVVRHLRPAMDATREGEG